LKNKYPKLLPFKKFAFNLSTRSLANLFSKVLGLITLPIITRALGPEAYGNYNLVMVIVQYTSLPIGLLGLRSYGIREIAAGRKKTSYAMDILSLQFSMAIISICISLIVAYFIFKANVLLLLAIVLGYLIVFARAFDLEFFFCLPERFGFSYHCENYRADILRDWGGALHKKANRFCGSGVSGFSFTGYR